MIAILADSHSTRKICLGRTDIGYAEIVMMNLHIKTIGSERTDERYHT